MTAAAGTAGMRLPGDFDLPPAIFDLRSIISLPSLFSFGHFSPGILTRHLPGL
jgi:hypothetical protein